MTAYIFESLSIDGKPVTPVKRKPGVAATSYRGMVDLSVFEIGVSASDLEKKSDEPNSTEDPENKRPFVDVTLRLRRS